MVYYYILKMSLCKSNLLLNTKYVENIEKKYSKIWIAGMAGIAQLVEQLIYNQ